MTPGEHMERFFKRFKLERVKDNINNVIAICDISTIEHIAGIKNMMRIGGVECIFEGDECVDIFEIVTAKEVVARFEIPQTHSRVPGRTNKYFRKSSKKNSLYKDKCLY